MNSNSLFTLLEGLKKKKPWEVGCKEKIDLRHVNFEMVIGHPEGDSQPQAHGGRLQDRGSTLESHQAIDDIEGMRLAELFLGGSLTRLSQCQ